MTKKITPKSIQQQTVIFYEDELTTVLVDHNGALTVYVPLLPICNYLELDWSAQYRRVRRDTILDEEAITIMLEATDGRNREMVCLPLELLNGWLFGINASRVKEPIKERLLRYQKECYRILADHFGARPIIRTTRNAGLAQVREMGLAIARLAEEQIVFESRLDDTETTIVDHSQRIAILEAKTSDEGAVTDAQASQISQAVKAVALILGQKSGRNEYGAIYGELYRRFEVSSYKLLPSSRFKEAMDWLTEWYQSISNDDVPF